MKAYQAEDAIACPHCEGIQDDVARDFVIPGREEKPIKYDCPYCEKDFTVRGEGGLYRVEKA
jgi:DNA-directed RNA polymerase subunit RPC12/RpoP